MDYQLEFSRGITVKEVINNLGDVLSNTILPEIKNALNYYRFYYESELEKGSYLIVEEYETIRSSVDWIEKYTKDNRLDIVYRAVEVLRNGIIKRIHEKYKDLPQGCITISNNPLIRIMYEPLTEERRDSIAIELYLAVAKVK